MKDQKITFQDFKNYMLEEGDRETRRRVNEALQIEGSQVRRWMDELVRRASDPIGGIDWLGVALLPEKDDSPMEPDDESTYDVEFADLLDRLFHGEGESTPPLGPVEVSFLDKVEELSAEKGPLHPELAFLAVREEWDAPDPPDLDDAYDVLRAMDQQGHLENRPVASTGAGLRGESAYLEPYYLPARSRPEVFAVTCGDLVRDVLEKGRPVDTVIAYAQSLGVPPELIETVKHWLRGKDVPDTPEKQEYLGNWPTGYEEGEPVSIRSPQFAGENREPSYPPAESDAEVIGACRSLIRGVLEGHPVDTVIAYTRSRGMLPEPTETAKHWLRQNM